MANRNPFSKFKDFNNAKPGGRKGDWFLPGQFKVKCAAIKYQDENHEGDEFYIAEFDVLTSNVPEIAVGARRSWVVNMTKPSAKGNIREFCAETFKRPLNEMTDEACAKSLSDDQPFTGGIYNLTCLPVPTAKGGTYTKHIWSLETMAPAVKAFLESQQANAA